MKLILSLFPGIDLFGRGFEAEGFCVVRGPDLIHGGDIRSFNVPSGKFDGVIGGPPCQDFSKARRAPPSGAGLAMLAEFARVVREAAPAWWLMENVPGVPDVLIDGYTHQRIDLNAREVGSLQNRHRHFQYGSRDNLTLTVRRCDPLESVERCCLASEASRPGRRDWKRFCELQGLDDGIDLPGMTLSARYRAVGNAVPLPVAQAMARAVKDARAGAVVCKCGCGRPVSGRARFAEAGCRKRMQRRRDSPVAAAPWAVTI